MAGNLHYFTVPYRYGVSVEKMCVCVGTFKPKITHASLEHLTKLLTVTPYDASVTLGSLYTTNNSSLLLAARPVIKKHHLPKPKQPTDKSFSIPVVSNLSFAC